jgi:hypothetical protein
MDKLFRYKFLPKHDEKINRLILDIISIESKTGDSFVNACLANGMFNLNCKIPRFKFKDLVLVRKERIKRSQNYQLYLQCASDIKADNNDNKF